MSCLAVKLVFKTKESIKQARWAKSDRGEIPRVKFDDSLECSLLSTLTGVPPLLQTFNCP